MRENKLLFSRLIFRLLLRHTVGRWDRVSIRGPREAGVNEKGGHAAPKNDVTAFRYFASLQTSHLHGLLRLLLRKSSSRGALRLLRSSRYALTRPDRYAAGASRSSGNLITFGDRRISVRILVAVAPAAAAGIGERAAGASTLGGGRRCRVRGRASAGGEVVHDSLVGELGERVEANTPH